MSGVPTGWSRKTLAEVARWGSGGTPQAGNPTYYGGPIPWAVIGDLNDNLVTDTVGAITELGLRESSAKLVPQGALLIAMYGSIGKLGLTGCEMATNQAIAFAIPDTNQVGLKYLFYYLMHQRDALVGAGKGATQKNISQTILKAWPIVLAPVAEQKRIVEILEEHLSRLDVAARSMQQSVRRLFMMRLAFLVDARRRLIADGTRMEPIGTLCDTALGKMLDARNESGEPTQYLRNINVRWGHIDLMDVSVVPLTSAERQRLVLRRGDLMVCEGGEPGRCAVWTGDTELMCYQKALHRVRMRDKRVTPYFVAAMLEEAVRTGRADRLFTGTTIKHLPQEKLRAVQIPVPAPEVQQSILRGLTDEDIVIQRLDRQIEQETRRTANLRRSLLRAAFTGQLSRLSMEVENTGELAGV